jgi:uncharacterized protein
LAHVTCDQPRCIIIVATSARMLAQSAQRAGFKTLVIDLWGDHDTRTFAEEVYQIPSLAEVHLLPVVANFVRQYQVTGAVYGSGFEQYIDGLNGMDSLVTLLGNQPDVFARINDKPSFFTLLKALHITYPQVSFSLPNDYSGWLVKPLQGHGGVGIRRYRTDDYVEPSAYWQKYQQGLPHSVLFLADGKRSQVVGFHRQWTTLLNDKDEFVFSGIINSTNLLPETKKLLSSWVDRLVSELSLKGLNSMDFIQFDQASFVLEINARPPASMQLYNEDLFARHIKACQGELVKYQPIRAVVSAYQIVFALQDSLIPDNFDWPKGAMDIPISNTIIRSGQPICSMIAHGNEPKQVLKQLLIKQELITNQLKRSRTHGIYHQR